MKLRIRDYLTLSTALLAILLSGYGVGFLLGEKKGRSQVTTSAISTRYTEKWQENTLAELSNRLDLNMRQKKLIAEEIQRIAPELHSIDADSLRRSARKIIELHDRILPHLTPEQKEGLQKSRSKVQ